MTPVCPARGRLDSLARCNSDVRPALVLAAMALLVGVHVHAQGRPARGQASVAQPSSAQSAAPIDLTGYWVAVISEDWRWRMITPAKGDYASIPLTPEGLRVADTWDPAKDERAGEQCRSYGAPGLMRGPARLHITWQGPDTLKLDTDYGTQTRLFHFGAWTLPAGPPTWQGATVARWETPRGNGAGRGDGRTPRFGSLATLTTHLRPGYLRKNGVPYSANAVLNEYWDLTKEPDGDQWLVITSIVTDQIYLQVPFTTALHFKKETTAVKWNPSPCSARW